MKQVECKEVIITTLARVGQGVASDPVRSVLQVWDKEGNLIAERDDHLLQKMEQYVFEPTTAIQKNPVEQEPPLLAAFGRKYKDGVYPNYRWYQLVYSELSGIANEEPPGPRLTLIHEAIRYILSRFSN
jgi:hypothetical protein